MGEVLGSISDHVASLRADIDAACARAGRNANGLKLMAVSKFNDADCVREAYRAGMRLFGESRVQEAHEKFPPLLAELSGIEVHMIGHLQSNKAKLAIGLFSCVESVDSEALALELDKRALAAGLTVDILLELRTAEETKSGFESEDALLRALDIARKCEGIRPRGLMTIAPYTQEEGPIRDSFGRLRRLFERAGEGDPAFDTLSMGMTNDYRIAIEEGSTLLRIGTAIFGRR